MNYLTRKKKTREEKISIIDLEFNPKSKTAQVMHMAQKSYPRVQSKMGSEIVKATKRRLKT